MVFKLFKRENKIKVQPKRLRYSIGSHIGSREEQQDCIHFYDSSDGISFDCMAFISDGMGGLRHGALASEYSIRKMFTSLRDIEGIEGMKDLLIKVAQEVSEELFQISKEKGAMGATLLGVFVKGGDLMWLSIGDSRIFILRDGELVQMNQTHEYFNELLEYVIQSEIERKDALNDSQGNRLTSYMGQEKIFHIECTKNPFQLREKDKLFICTDGITSTLSEDEIKYIIENTEFDRTISKLVEQTLSYKHPNQDNLSAMLIEYIGE